MSVVESRSERQNGKMRENMNLNSDIYTQNEAMNEHRDDDSLSFIWYLRHNNGYEWMRRDR